MLNPKERSDYEQNLALMGEMWPRIWASLFRGCLKEGFSPAQSMDLLKTYILAANSTNITPTSDPPSRNDPQNPDISES